MREQYKDIIKEGDRVEVWPSDDTYPNMPGVVIYTPEFAGEYWQIKLDDGDVLALSPSSPAWAGLCKRAPRPEGAT